ncbi:MAG: hypothetical protein ACTSQE_06675 [Candidatus Heimdallarchaeaceae archaeon]
MVLSTTEARSEETNLDIIVKNIELHLHNKGYVIKRIEKMEHTSIMRIRRGLISWQVELKLNLSRTGNYVIVSISRLESKFRLPLIQRGKKQNEEQQSQPFWNLFWRWRWYLYIASAIGAAILAFIPKVSTVVTYLGYALFSLIGTLFILYLAQFLIQGLKTQREFKGAEELSETIKQILAKMVKIGTQKVKYCWQCFSEIPEGSDTCPKCKAKVVKL